MGHDVFSVDWTHYTDIDLVKDIGLLTVDDLPWIPDMVWASPDCTTYTIAAISTHRDGVIPKSKYAAKCDDVNRHVMGLLAELCAANPYLVWFIENPRGMMRKMPWLQNVRRETVWYCQYGDDRAKPTDVWTNSQTWVPRPMCKNGSPTCHHQRAPRGAKTGTQGRKGSYNRSMIPPDLCLEVIQSVRSELVSL